MITEFYAVTVTSLYRIFMLSEKATVCTAMKLKSKTVASAVKPGQILGGCGLIALTRYGLIAYVDPIGGRTPIELVSSRHWGGRTSHIVGLFADEASAEDCFSQEGSVPGDPRWAAETKAVIAAIGDDHPCFIPTQVVTLRFE